MSVGGQVVETIDCGDVVWVDTRERYRNRDGLWKLCQRSVAVYVDRTDAALCIEPGDSIWWQGRDAMWTPRAGGRSDIRLKRIGFSGISRGTALLRCAEAAKGAAT